MLTYNQAKEWVTQRSGTVRAVIFSCETCMSCATVASVLEANNIPYEKLDIGDPDLFFKPGNWPVTYFFVEDDSCWPRGDVFDTDMLNWHLNNIKEIKKQNG